MKHLAGWADAHYLLLAPHNVCGPVGTMANVHFAIATPNYKLLEHFNDFADPWVQDLVDHPPRVVGRGRLLRPSRSPGSRRPAEPRRLRGASPDRRTAASVRGGLGETGQPLTTDTVADRTVRRVRRRLIPFLALLYFVAYLDRVNVGFARCR